MTFQLFIVILSGVLALACPGVLESVQARRVRHGWGLTDYAPPDTVLIAVQDCSLLGRDGHMAVEGLGRYRVRVVDCQSAHHRAVAPLSGLGLVADVNAAELNHRRAVVVLGELGGN